MTDPVDDLLIRPHYGCLDFTSAKYCVSHYGKLRCHLPTSRSKQREIIRPGHSLIGGSLAAIGIVGQFLGAVDKQPFGLEGRFYLVVLAVGVGVFLVGLFSASYILLSNYTEISVEPGTGQIRQEQKLMPFSRNMSVIDETIGGDGTVEVLAATLDDRDSDFILEQHSAVAFRLRQVPKTSLAWLGIHHRKTHWQLKDGFSNQEREYYEVRVVAHGPHVGSTAR